MSATKLIYIHVFLAIFPILLGSITGTINVNATGSMTTGLVGEMSHQILPSVPPIATLTLTVLSMTVSTIVCSIM